MAIITSADLVGTLNEEVINEAFEIARSNRTGILSTVSMGSPLQAFDGYKMSWLEMQVNATQSTLTSGIHNSVTTIPVADGALFRAGMTFSVDAYSEFFHEGKMNDGSDFNYTIEVVTVSAEEAVIRITAN